MALDIRTVRDESEARALAKARVEHGNNFVILGGKEIPVKSFLGFGKKKTEYELRIMLIDSIYEGKRNNAAKSQIAVVDDTIAMPSKNLETDRLIPQKQVGTISSNEMANRLVAITKLAKDSLKERAVNTDNITPNNTATATLEKVVGRDAILSNNNVAPHYDDMIVSREDKVKALESLRERNNDIDKKVEEMVESKVRNLINEYLAKRIDTTSTREEVSNSQLSDYESYIKHDHNIVREQKRENYSNVAIDEKINNNFKAIDLVNDRKDNNIKENKENIVIKKENVRKAINNADEECDIENYLEYLRDRDFPKEIVKEMKDYLSTYSDARFYQSFDVCKSEGLKYIEERLQLNDGIDVVNSKKKIIVLLGPTGVGKTTTLPKIAANYIKSGKKVSFVTIDNYRIAAVDQLQRYASIMKVPFKSVASPDALRTEVRNMEMNSILFVDTTGRSPKAAEDIVALSKYFATVGRFDIDIQLVMSATVKYNDAENILNSFKPTNYKGVILTKTDETDYLASSVCAIMKSNCPITYATFGQAVPKDIATGLKYKNKIMEGLYGLS